MSRLSTTVGVAVFVLRRRDSETRVLLTRHGGVPDDGRAEVGWSPLRRDLAAEEREAAAAAREMEAAEGLEVESLYALPVHFENLDAWRGPVGRIGLFVARVAPESELTGGGADDRRGWFTLDEARDRLGSGGTRDVLGRVWEGFVRQPPDEGLRVL